MTRIGRPLRFALAVAAVALSLAPAALAASHQPWSPQDLENQLMCPTCHVPLNQSDSQAAQDIRDFVQQRHDAGWSEQRTKQALIDRFGPQILAAPPFRGFDALAWLVPALLLGLGIMIATGLAWTWSHSRTTPTADDDLPTLDPALVARIDADLDHLD